MKSNILKPKSEDELNQIKNKIDHKIYLIKSDFSNKGFNIIESNVSTIEGGLAVVFEFDNDITFKQAESVLDDYDYVIEDIFGAVLVFYIPTYKINEAVGGAGFAIYGGGFGGGFGNPSMRGVGGRGLGMNGNATSISGQPNVMYTYGIKPLNKLLEPAATPQNNEQYIHVGSNIKGNILNSKKDIEGTIIKIEKDEDNNIKWYLVLDTEKKPQKVDPTSCYIIEPEVSNFIETDIIEECFYPNLIESKSTKGKDNPYDNVK